MMPHDHMMPPHMMMNDDQISPPHADHMIPDKDHTISDMNRPVSDEDNDEVHMMPDNDRAAHMMPDNDWAAHMMHDKNHTQPSTDHLIPHENPPMGHMMSYGDQVSY